MSWLWGSKKVPTDEDFLEKPFNDEEKRYSAIISQTLLAKGYEQVLNQMYPDTLLRFVRAFMMNDHAKKSEQQKISETTEHVIYYCDQFKKYGFDTILDKNSPKNKGSEDTDTVDYTTAWPLFGYGYDKYGHPIYWDCVCDSTEMKICEKFATCDESDGHYEMDWDLLFGYKYKFMRRLHNCKLMQSEKLGKNIYKHILIFDVSKASLGLKEFMGMKAQCTKKIVQTDGVMFPETVYRLYIVNASKAFRLIWGIIASFLDPLTTSKTQVLGTDFLKELTKQVSLDQIPPKYGGTGKWDIKLAHIADLDKSVVDKYHLSLKKDNDQLAPQLKLPADVSKPEQEEVKSDGEDNEPNEQPDQEG